jgi:hypothetical protein
MILPFLSVCGIYIVTAIVVGSFQRLLVWFVNRFIYEFYEECQYESGIGYWHSSEAEKALLVIQIITLIFLLSFWTAVVTYLLQAW